MPCSTRLHRISKCPLEPSRPSAAPLRPWAAQAQALTSVLPSTRATRQKATTTTTTTKHKTTCYYLHKLYPQAPIHHVPCPTRHGTRSRLPHHMHSKCCAALHPTTQLLLRLIRGDRAVHFRQSVPKRQCKCSIPWYIRPAFCAPTLEQRQITNHCTSSSA